MQTTRRGVYWWRRVYLGVRNVLTLIFYVKIKMELVFGGVLP